MDSLFIDEHKTERQGLKYGKRKVRDQIISYLGQPEHSIKGNFMGRMV